MTALDRKAWRDLRRMRGQAIAIGALVGCAMAAWVSTAMTERALVRTRDAFYAEQDFADAFAGVRRAPDWVERRLAAIPGVSEVETRVVWPGRVALPGGRDARATFVSLPEDAAPRLNRPVVRSGRELGPAERGSALLSEGFAIANGLEPGDALEIVVNGRKQEVRVAGVAISPEFVLALGPGMAFPDDRSFGVVWMSRDDLGPAAGLDGAFNSASFRLAPSADRAEVLEDVDRVLAAWGGTGAYGREDQVSNRYLSEEILQLRGTAVVIPGIFLAVAAFLLSVVTSRLVAAQRQQIGMLKALGYADGAIAAHYARLVGAIVIAGGAVGTAGGFALGRAFARIYAEFYRLPFLRYGDAPAVVAAGAALIAAAALAGVASAVRRAARLPPAEAMRPEPPAQFRVTALDRLAVSRAVPPAWRMTFRNLSRRPVRALLSTVGIASGIAIVVVVGALLDAFAHILRVQFEQARREDVLVAFSEAAGRDATVELRGLEGVRRVERFRSVPVTFRNGARERRTELTGLEPGGVLWRLADERGHAVPVPPAGVVLSSHLSAELGVAPGEEVEVEVHEGRRPIASIPVVALVDDVVGVSATASLDALNAVMRDGDLANGALIAADPERVPAVAKRLSERPRVAGVTTGGEFRASIEAVVRRYVAGMIAIVGAFSLVLSGGVVYNAARVAYAERQRDLATLRVLGFTDGEAWRILAGELAVLVALAIPSGWALGLALVSLSSGALSSELFRLPVVVAPRTWLGSAGAVACLSAVLVVAARRWVRRLDLVAVLKTRE